MCESIKYGSSPEFSTGPNIILNLYQQNKNRRHYKNITSADATTVAFASNNIEEVLDTGNNGLLQLGCFKHLI